MKNCHYQTAFRNHMKQFNVLFLQIICLSKFVQASKLMFSIESEAENIDINQDQRRRMENYLWWRRKGVLIIILVFFILTGTVLSFSVFYDQTIRVINVFFQGFLPGPTHPLGTPEEKKTHTHTHIYIYIYI